MDKNFVAHYNNMVESLKRHQRAELLAETKENLIETLYTDPFENDFVLNSMLNDQMTLLIGRKGTGKSTIINRFQHEIRKSKDKISLYIDVRTIYSKAKDNGGDIENQNTLSFSEQTKYNLYSGFIKSVIKEIEEEIKKNIFQDKTWKQKITDLLFINKINKTKEEFEKELKNTLNKYLQITYTDISKYKEQITQRIETTENSIQNDTSIGARFDSQPSLKFKQQSSDQNKDLNSEDNKFASLLKREYHISNFTDEIKTLLLSIGIQKVFICLDDSSELDKEALQIFVKTIISPLHNNSEGFFRFKMALYPERNTLPEIDRTKIDTVFLDYFHMYQSSGVDKVEEFAVQYVKRLLKQRIKYFFKTENVPSIEEKLFDTKNISIEEYYKLIFHMCSSIPRNIGKLLYYASKRSISQGKPITKGILQESIEEQYKNDIEPAITKDEFFQYKSYDEQFSRTQLKDLIARFIAKAKENKRKIGESNAIIFKNYTSSNAPSHFLHVEKNKIEKYLSTLEINFFISRLSEQKGKGDMVGKEFKAKDIVVYTLNYGLCQKENIIFENPSDRKYRIERLFDFDKIVEEWANGSANVICKHCNTEYDISEWETISEYNKTCRKCKEPNVCEIQRVQNPIQTESNDVPNSLLKFDLKDEQLRIIHTLKIEDNLMESAIAAELDVSKETVRAYLREDRKLRTSDLIIRNETNKTYCLSDKLKQIFNV